MPLPQKVVEQLGREPVRTQGWAPGALLFASGILFLALIVWAGLTFGYGPYLEGQISATKNKIDALNNSVSVEQETQLIDYYSQTANLQTLLAAHVYSSQLFSWLEKNTEANVYYQSFNLSQGGHITVTGIAPSEADINQQVAIYENSPEVKSVGVSSVSAPLIPGAQWTFNASLVMAPSVFGASTPQSQ